MIKAGEKADPLDSKIERGRKHDETIDQQDDTGFGKNLALLPGARESARRIVPHKRSMDCQRISSRTPNAQPLLHSPQTAVAFLMSVSEEYFLTSMVAKDFCDADDSRDRLSGRNGALKNTSGLLV